MQIVGLITYISWSIARYNNENKALHVLDSSSVHHQKFFTVRTAICICHTGLLTAGEQDHDGTSWSCSQAVWRIPLLCVQWKTPDDGQRNCPKRVEFYSENKFEKLVYLVGFIITIYHDARSRELQLFITMHGHVNVKFLSRCTVTWTSNSLKC